MRKSQVALQPEFNPVRSDVAFMFPGQGSQAVGMLARASSAFPCIKATFTEASDVLGIDLWAMAQEGDAETLAMTANTQPLILAASTALYRAWELAGGVRPSIVAGHSLGEFSALVAADSLQFADAIQLVRLRGQAMQEAVPLGHGAMAAVLGLDDETINSVCADIADGDDNQVLAVNFNSPGQVVIAGHTAPVEAASSALKAAGAKRVMPLPVSAPFHTPLMGHAAMVLSDALGSTPLAHPSVPVVSNVTGQPLDDALVISEALVEQVVSPVQWTRCISTMRASGCRHFVECGPGKVLAGLLRRIDRDASAHCIEEPDNLQVTLETLDLDHS